MKVKLRNIYGQPSWRLATGTVEAYVTRLGGHLGPVRFGDRNRRLRPYAIAPWAQEPLDPHLPAILRVLRGDFFCLPFGGNGTAFGKEKHPIHGETANAAWSIESLSRRGDRTTLHLSLQTRTRRGRVDKWIQLVRGHSAVYCRHRISGMKGPMTAGHHAMLKFPSQSRSGIVATSPFIWGQVFPGAVERPEDRGYSLLRPGARFTSLRRVPTILGEPTDLSRFPARPGFEDIAMVVSDPEAPFAWTAVAFPRQRYVWFALKDPRVLRHTVFWFSNGGRHYPPWNGRHLEVMGLEEVTAYFHSGLAESAHRNPLSAAGHPTTLALRADRPTVLNYIMAVAGIPPRFDGVKSITPSLTEDAVRLVSVSGKTVTVPLDLGFLGGGSEATEGA